MKLVQELVAEHELIEAVVGSFRAYVAERLLGRGNVADGPRFVEFLGTYAGHFHHAREEDTLFVALVERAQLPEAGPVQVLRDDHARLAGLLSQIGALLGRGALDASEARQLQALALEYSRGLWSHIDAENSVLLPEAEARLRKCGVAELPSRPMTEDERAARETGEALLARYPPAADAGALRGDGCVCCPAMTVSCRGLELEWWNEWEWEECEDHLASG